MPPEPFKFDGVWSEWKREQYSRLCKGTVLDYGCHTGEMVEWLTAKCLLGGGERASGYDIDANKILEGLRRNHWLRLYNKLPNLKFDTVIAWNVLEHIEDDQSALLQMLKMARQRVVLSVPKEDDLSLPDSRVTYRPYVDPTHKHYYTEERLRAMLPSGVRVRFEHTTRVRPALAYAKLGIPRWLCVVIDNLMWVFGRGTALHANLVVVIDK